MASGRDFQLSDSYGAPQAPPYDSGYPSYNNPGYDSNYPDYGKFMIFSIFYTFKKENTFFVHFIPLNNIPVPQNSYKKETHKL